MDFLNALAKALESFHHADPAGWFGWRSMLGPHVAFGAIAVGLFCLTLGAREGIFRFVAVPLGVLMGVALTGPVQELLKSTAIPPSAIALGLPGALGLLSGFLPHTIAFVTLGGVGALAGAAVMGENEMVMGAVPGFFIAGVLGIVLSRVVDTIASAAFGALLVVGGLWAAFPKGGVGKLLESSPWTPAIIGALLLAGGAALQLVLHENADDRATRKAAALDKKNREKDDRAREKRFASYGQK
ncbi:MAG: hypothetical protein JST54_29560 [Deltaproteobacteria bacterium]|nr:hypothetical protein [Deltaproteobacteria bacterium]